MAKMQKQKDKRQNEKRQKHKKAKQQNKINNSHLAGGPKGPQALHRSQNKGTIGPRSSSHNITRNLQSQQSGRCINFPTSHPFSHTPNNFPTSHPNNPSQNTNFPTSYPNNHTQNTALPTIRQINLAQNTSQTINLSQNTTLQPINLAQNTTFLTSNPNNVPIPAQALPYPPPNQTTQDQAQLPNLHKTNVDLT